MLSHKPEDTRPDLTESPDIGDALALLSRVFPGFAREIQGKDVLDFGCGAGLQSVAMANCGARFVLGLDTNPKTLARARELATRHGFGDSLHFADSLGDEFRGKFDIVISQNSMEHFPDPAAVLDQMKSVLRPGGRVFVTFGPPWLAPYGSHMRFFTRVPWVNVLFPESAVMKVRSRFVGDGATRYEDVEGGLNKMTVSKFERIVALCGLEMSDRRYECVKGLDFLAKPPFVRELFINHVSCVLRRAQDDLRQAQDD